MKIKLNLVEYCKENNLLLLDEWDYEINKRPEEYTHGSHSKVHWICKNDNEHKWVSVIKNRVNRSGCPECYKLDRKINHFLPTKSNPRPENENFLTHYPDIAKYWDYNKNIKLPKDYSPKSKDKVWWICSKNIEHSWEARISSRINAENCIHCNNNFISKIKEKGMDYLLREWSDKNIFGPENYSYSSVKSVWWKCEKNPEHEWEAPIRYGTVSHNNCAFCSKNVSKKETAWIDWIVTSFNDNNILRQQKILLCNGKKIGVDGYDPINKIAYQFHGDFWHGNPEVYQSYEINKKVKKSFGELFEKTKNNDELIRKSGYILVVLWERDWDIVEKLKLVG